MLSDGSYGIIKSIKIEKLSEPETTYNFEVEDFHTYFVGTNEVLVHNACLKVNAKDPYDFELDPRSIAEAKQGDPSWNTFRKRVWQNEAKYNSAQYARKQLNRMAKGLAPKVDGVPMQLHHVVGKANDMYNVVKLTRSQHILFHKIYGYHYNANWNIGSLIELFG